MDNRLPILHESPEEHITRLEKKQENIEAEKRNNAKEIFGLERLLPPNPSTHDPVQRPSTQERPQGASR